MSGVDSSARPPVLLDGAKAVLRYAAIGPALGTMMVLPFVVGPAIAAVFREASLVPLLEALAACFSIAVASVFVGLPPALGSGLLLASLRHSLGALAAMALAAAVGATLTMAWISRMSFPLTPWKYGVIGGLAAALVSLTFIADVDEQRGWRGRVRAGR